jgi:hypothetical protein
VRVVEGVVAVVVPASPPGPKPARIVSQRVSRRIRGWARADGVPVIDCIAAERKHRIAEDYLRDHTVGVGVFLVLVARAPARVEGDPVEADRQDLQPGEDPPSVNQYSFHIMDPTSGM